MHILFEKSALLVENSVPICYLKINITHLIFPRKVIFSLIFLKQIHEGSSGKATINNAKYRSSLFNRASFEPAMC